MLGKERSVITSTTYNEHIFTARIRRMTKGYVFTLSTTRVYPIQADGVGGGGSGAVTPISAWGYPIQPKGVPPYQAGWVTSPSTVGMDVVPPSDYPSSRRQSSTASTCYVAGGMPQAFMQEDFLVMNKINLCKQDPMYFFGRILGWCSYLWCRPPSENSESANVFYCTQNVNSMWVFLN